MSAITYGSVCSGIEAATVAWHSMGWRAAWLAEIEPAPAAVLAHHYPDVPNLGDMTKIAAMVRAGTVAAPDVLVGGTPCQAFSIAGLRNSLEDARGQLSLSFVDLANAIDAARIIRGEPAATVLWENVPGVLSTSDNAFGCFLGALAGEDEPVVPAGKKWTNAGCVFGPQRTVAWRVIDAQYFGVAQRRRRVFVVASARDGFDPASVLFERDGLRRDIAPSRETGQSVAGTIEASAGRSCGAGTPPAIILPVHCLAHGQGGAELGIDRAPTLTCNHEAPIAAYPVAMRESGQGYWMEDEIAGTLRAEGENRPSRPSHVIALSVALRGRDGGATAELGGNVAGTLRASGGGGDKAHVLAFDSHQDCVSSPHVFGALGSSSPQAQAVCVTGDITRTLKAEGFDGSEDGTGRGNPIVTAMAFQERGREGGRSLEIGGDVAYALTAPAGGGRAQERNIMTPAMAVRRLTPKECARLQGFPDLYLSSVIRNSKPLADGPMYKAFGNSMAVPCMAFIGQRINSAIKESA